MIERRFNIPFVAGMALREKQIQQNYRPVIAVHKWFARRPPRCRNSLLKPLPKRLHPIQNPLWTRFSLA
jgi:hypothetical protein